MTQATTQELMEQIRRGDEQTLEELYKRYRSVFLPWAMKRQCSKEEAAEVYQKAFTIFYFNIRDGKLTELSSKLETYLFGIGKRVLLELYRARQKQNLSLDEVPETRELDYSYLDRDSTYHQKQTVAALLGRLGEACREILKLYYFKKYSMESIAENLGYKNDKVAKKKKYECLKKLKSMVDEAGYDAGDLLGN